MMAQIGPIEDYPTFRLETGTTELPCCRYLDIVNCPDYDWGNKFSIVLFNIRSCRKNFIDFISYFDNVISNYACVILIETWLTSEYDNLFTLGGFSSFNVYRNNYGGGIRLYVKNSFNVNLLSQYTFVDNICEMLCVEITCDVNKFVLCCTYHPPTADHAINNNFIDKIYQVLLDVRSLGLPVLLAGDMNLNLFNPLKLNYIPHFINSMLELGLLPIINIPTKFNPQNLVTKFSLLDQFWVTSSLKPVDSYVIPIEITDHFPVTIALSFNTTTVNTNGILRVFKHGNNVKFTRLVTELIPVVVDDNMNTTFEVYYANLFRIYDTSFPKVRRMAAINRSDNNEWLTPRIRTCIKKKSKLYSLYFRGHITRESYTFYANRLTTLLNKSRKVYYFKLFYRDIKNTKKTWSNINRVTGSTARCSMEKLLVGGETLTGMRMVNYANEYFVSIANRLTEEMQINGQFMVYTERNPYTFEMRPTDVREVVKVIYSLKNKGNGLLDISVVTIKNNSQVFAVHIVLLYNYSIEKCVFPCKLKIAKVVPGHKSGPKDLIDNFRPISNLPVFSKIFEKLTHTRMMAFIERYKLLSESQYGFRKGKCTTHAAMKLTSMIVKAYHSKEYAACFYLDLRKAFDIIDHDILLKKIDLMGFRGHSSQYFSSYLKGRKQYLQVGEHRSNEFQITKGVPQGSVLGPVLFCLYINDIVKAVNVEVVLFADDAAFIITADTLDRLYEKIVKLFADLGKYLEVNRLIPNLNKSKLMYFDSRPIPELRNIAFNGQDIEWVDEYKYLGLTITSKMSFAIHINKITSHVSRFVGSFYCLRMVIPRPVLLMLYSSFVLPHILLHIEIWGAAPAVHISKLDIKINMLLRSIIGARYVDYRPTIETTAMYNQLGILKLKSVFKLRLFNLLASLLRGVLPDLFELLLDPYLKAHNRTRNRMFRVPLVSCEVERRAVSYQLINLYQNIPPQYCCMENNSLKKLVSSFKKYLFAVQ